MENLRRSSGLNASTSGRYSLACCRQSFSRSLPKKQIIQQSSHSRRLCAHDDGKNNVASSNTASDQDVGKKLPPQMIAAMALSPIAALSLSLVQNEEWAQGMKDFVMRLRIHANMAVENDMFKDMVSSLDENITFMDWTYKLTGIDLTYAWDPELWVKFKDAIWSAHPQMFWNELADRIEYRGLIPQAGIVGDMRISYAKFLQLLEANRIKRVVVYGDMKTAIVEVPHPWYASILGVPEAYPWLKDNFERSINLLIPNPKAPHDPLQWYCPEMPEWNMEKYRFYVDLPGDFWDQGVMLQYLRSREVQVSWDEKSGHYVLPEEAFNKVLQVRTELQLLDPNECWDFLAWLTSYDKLQFYEKAAAFCVFGRACTMILTWFTASPAYRMWDNRKKKKKSKEQSMWDKLTASTAREFMTKDAKTGKLRDTGVRFADIAGLDHIIFEMREVVKMLLGDPVYKKVGAKVPRGIIFQGPPGTGKTYMARAIAGEAGVAFFSSVGSEFVEMYAGVAAARVNNLFVTARKRSPSIIFIDEIDAIGRARSAQGGDPGSMERESALLAMLVQMDGIHGKLEQVLTIGATNLAQDLDQALLRPGRFEAVYEIPSPGPVARMEILKYHSRNKPLESPSILSSVAEVTQGWSAASLANLMNEAAILTVRRNVEKISLPMILELVEGINWGVPAIRIPPSEAKNRIALVTAARAVAFALTPGMEEIKFATLWSQRKGVGPYVEFVKSEESLDPNVHPEMMEVLDWKTNYKTNAATIGNERLGEFYHLASLLLPLYSPRAAELAFFGKDSVSLATAAPLSDCFQIAYHCVRHCNLHPRFRNLPPLHTYMALGEDRLGRNQEDPLSVGLAEELGYHKLTLTLLKASWRRSQRLVAQHRSAIIKVAEVMLTAEDEKISGSDLVNIIESTPLDDASDYEIDSDFMPILKEVLGKVPNIILEGAKDLDEEPKTSKSYGGSAVEAVLPATGLTFQADTAGRVGSALFSRSTASKAPVPISAATFQQDLPGRVGFTSFSRSPAPVSGETENAEEDPLIRLDEETLRTVSRAIMGRLDIVDLVGRATAYETAERVRDALLDPKTVERLRAVRKFVEETGAPFPPEPLEQDISGPLYGKLNGTLEYWNRRHFSTISMSAVEMLYSERQMKWFKEDMDEPKFEDTSFAREAAEKATKAQGKLSGTDEDKK